MPSIEEQRRLLLERMNASGEDRPPPAARRTRKRAGLPPAQKKRTLLARFERFFPVIPFLLILIAVIVYAPPLNNELPPYLIGLWRSSTPGYEDRYMLFTQHSVVFGTGGFSGDVNVIYEVQASPVEAGAPAPSVGRELFTIRYLDAEKSKSDLQFYYDPPPAGVITFKNQEHLKWTKEK
jgi:hypothetical protein